MSSSSCRVVAHPTEQPSLLPDMLPGLANSVSASPKDAVQLGTNGSHSRLQRSGSQDVTLVVQEEMQPRSGSPRINRKVTTPKREVPARLRSIPTPSLLSGNNLRRSSDNPLHCQPDWEWFEQGTRNDKPALHQGPGRDGILGNQLPSISANVGLNGVSLPMQTSLSGHQQDHTFSF